MAYPLDVGGVEDYPVKVGSALITMVDPNPGYENAYNRWYERDHFYAGCMIGPFLFAGSRWVATRPMKDARWPQLRSGLSVRAVIAHGEGDPRWAAMAAREMAELEIRYNRPQKGRE